MTEEYRVHDSHLLDLIIEKAEHLKRVWGKKPKLPARRDNVKHELIEALEELGVLDEYTGPTPKWWEQYKNLPKDFPSRGRHENMPVVAQVLRFNGEPGQEAFDKFGPDGVFALHFGDWGSIWYIFEALGIALFGNLRTTENERDLVLRIMRKSDGKVLVVVRIEIAE